MLNRFAYLAMALGLATAGACSKDDTRDNAENAAESVKEHTADLQDEAKDLEETAKDKAEDLADRDVDRTGVARNGVVETVEEAGDRAEDKAELAKDTVEDVNDESREMMKKGIETRDALKEFEYQRMVRVQTLRAVHGITASQPMLINAIASAHAMPQNDRAKLNEKVQLVQMRLDESANLIQSLEGVDAAHWEDRERDVAKAMERLEDAREDAWEALDEADDLDQTSMR